MARASLTFESTLRKSGNRSLDVFRTFGDSRSVGSRSSKCGFMSAILVLPASLTCL